MRMVGDLRAGLDISNAFHHSSSMEFPRAPFVCPSWGASRTRIGKFTLASNTVLDSFGNHAFTADARGCIIESPDLDRTADKK